VLAGLFSWDILECSNDTHPILHMRRPCLPRNVQDINLDFFSYISTTCFGRDLGSCTATHSWHTSCHPYPQPPSKAFDRHFCHVPLLQHAATFVVPQNTISQPKLRLALRTLGQVPRLDADTKFIPSPCTLDAMNSTSCQVHTKFGLSTVLAALDGSLIPPKKTICCASRE
jgi:hypothetical protein